MTLRLFLAGLLIAIPTSVVALDFAAMEAMVIEAKRLSAAQPSADADCNTPSANQENKSLPSDFDYCQPDLQQNLVNKGLYLSVNGDTKPLPVVSSRKAPNSQVKVPLPVHDDVASEPVSPFVLSLE